ncbi:hypothetical protein CEXT_789711 [Caerostris extrusa]|uniref:Uncharacterized protein n=1 Tax=Caerostris extrusa TaxID=172846 RepID=A0AAV4YC85_CAEEX|nr:hypothetical protein CEXT_789711 [Caerostris extrusa]
MTVEVLFYAIAVVPDKANLLSSGSGSYWLMEFYVRPEIDLSGFNRDRKLRTRGGLREYQDIRNRIPALPFFTSLRVCGWQKGEVGRINEQLSKKRKKRDYRQSDLLFHCGFAGQGDRVKSTPKTFSSSFFVSSNEMALVDFMVPFIFLLLLRTRGELREHQDIRNRIPALPFFTSLRVCGWQKGEGRPD